MSLKDAYREKMEARLEEQKARLELLKAKAKHAVATGKVLAYEELSDADTKFTDAKARLKELGATGGEAWHELKDGMELAWAALSDASTKAADKFKTNNG
ncbi:MAG TPA: hypothetical protein VG347_04565 [Verrucomicrobiae bacterium]|nr:hypothetical protein [Verrucomicrobiae bacterium]